MKQVLFNLLLAFFISGGAANAATNTLHDKPLKTAPASADETYVWDTGTSTLKKTTFAPFLVGDCTGFPCLDGTSDGGNYIKLWAGTGSYWTALQGGSPAANRSWRLPIAAPPAAGTTYLMNMDEYGQMGFVDPDTIGGGATVINDLTDVDTTGKATGKILKFDSSGNLVVGDDATGSGSVPSGTVNGQVLIWATDQWVASTAPWLTTTLFSTEQDWTAVQNFDAGLTATGVTITMAAISDIKLGAGNWLDDTKGNGDTNYLWSADKIFDQLALKAASDHTHTGTYEPADANIIKVAEIDSLAEFEALLGWSPGSGGSFAFDTFPTYEDSAHSSGIAVSGTTLAIYSTVASKWLTVGLTDSLNPTPVTYAATLTITDASATADTFTLNSVAYDVGDSPVSVTNLPTDTEQITYTGSNTAACTGNVTGTGPWTINASPATIGCTITLASSGITDDFNRADGGLGASWDTISSLTAPVIVSQAVKTGTEGYLAGAFRTSPTYTSNQSSIIKITESDGGNYGPVVRASLTQYGYHMTHTWEGWVILKAYDNQLVATSGAAATDGSYLKLTAVGTTPTVITGYVCSTPTTCTQVVTYSDATSPHTGGSPGFRAYNTATIIDDFYGTSL